MPPWAKDAAGTGIVPRIAGMSSRGGSGHGHNVTASGQTDTARGDGRGVWAEVRLEPGFAIGGRERQWMLAFSGPYWLAYP